LPPPPSAPDSLALFLDIDGTLLEFADHPDDVVVEPSLSDCLHRVSEMLGGALALLSGRSLARIDQLLGVPDLPAAGSHGAELRRANGAIQRQVRDATGMASLRAYARTVLADWPDVVIEDKPDAIALHYRAAPAAATSVSAAAERLASAAGPRYRLQRGDCVVELRGAGANKGDALAKLMQEAPFAGRTPWMIGDDLTDEHAFAAADRLGGVGIIVGTRTPTRARFSLAGPGAVRAWLANFARATDDETPFQ
jgi:trehalose 6-phosphate phosphatase